MWDNIFDCLFSNRLKLKLVQNWFLNLKKKIKEKKNK